jgi:predicted phage terminase large subunit-like protein
MIPSETEVHRALYRMHFQNFVMGAFETLYGAGQYNDAWFVRAMCEMAEKVAKGDLERLLVTIPPRHLKSFVMCICLPAWVMGRAPTFRVMIASYAASLAETHAREFRRLINTPWYRALFPGLEIADGANRASLMETTQGGGLQAVGRRGSATGFGADLLIIDDILNAEEARSIVERDNAIEFYTGSLRTRLNDQRKTRVIIIQQRLHELDLAGYTMGLGIFTHINLPSISEETRTFDLGSGETYIWEKGELLDHVRHPQEVLDALRLEMGDVRFNCQYMQNPILPGGNIIRWEWFGEYTREYERSAYQRVVQSWDTAFSTEDDRCFSVCLTFGLREGKWDLIDVWRRQADFPTLRREALRLSRIHKADEVLVEGAASGHSLFQEMRQERAKSGHWMMITPRGSKEERAQAQSAKLATGIVRVRRGAQWLPAFRHEVQGFPHAQYDDQVDALIQFVKHINTGRGRTFPDTDPETGRRIRVRRRDIPRR